VGDGDGAASLLDLPDLFVQDLLASCLRASRPSSVSV
jgi:hypothetical protein